jgi:hypothetical protein
MVKIIDSSDLKDMTLSELKKHAKLLRRGGYPISGYSNFVDSPSDLKKFRQMIRNTQKAGKSKSSSKKSSSKASSPKSGCESNFENITKCMKNTSAVKVKKIALGCGLDATKPKTILCPQLLKLQDKAGGKGSKNKTPVKTPVKTPGSSLKTTDEYKKLNKLKKKAPDEDDLQDMARKLKISYGNQDGENITMGKLRKHELIIAILQKKGKRTPTPPKKKSSKKKRTPTPPKKKSSKKKRTPTPPKKKSSKKKRTPTPPKKKSSKKKSKVESMKIRGRKIIGTEGALRKLKTTMKKSKKLHDPWSEKGLKRKQLINKVSLATGRPKSFYNDWSEKELKQRLEGIVVIEDEMKIKNTEQSKQDEKEARRIMINDIIKITGEKASAYKKETFDEIIYKLHQLRDEHEIDEEKYDSRDEESSSDDEDSSKPKTLSPPKKKKKKTPTPESSADDSSSEDEESSKQKTPTLPKKKKQTPTPESSSEDSGSDESSKLEEDSEIVDLDSTLSNVISGQKNIGKLANVQTHILKCMGLLS